MKESVLAQTIEAPPATKAQPRANESESRTASSRALAAFNLRKSYGRRRVVDDVTLHVEPGEVVGLLGANGAGKTTTFPGSGNSRPHASLLRGTALPRSDD